MDNSTRSNHQNQRRTLVFITTLITFAILVTGIGLFQNVPVDSASAPMQAMASQGRDAFSHTSYYTTHLPLVVKQSPGTSGRGFEIAGIVYDAAGGIQKPIAGAAVFIRSDGLNRSTFAGGGQDGRFVLFVPEAYLNQSSVTVGAQAEGFDTMQTTYSPAELMAQPELAAGLFASPEPTSTSTPDPRLTATPTPPCATVIEGKVVDAVAQQPVAGATVKLWEHPGIATTTDDAGYYRLVYPYHYTPKVQILASGYRGLVINKPLPGGCMQASIDFQISQVEPAPTPFPTCTLTPTPTGPYSTPLPTPTSARPDCSLYFVSFFPPDIDGNTVTFNWEPAYSYGYHIQVADNQAFVTPTVDVKVDSTTYSYTTDLGDGVWYWRIRLDALIRCNVGQVMHPSGEIWSPVAPFSVGGSVTPTETPTATHDIEVLILTQVDERMPLSSAFGNTPVQVAPPYYYLTCLAGAGHSTTVTIKRHNTPLDAQSAFSAAYGDQPDQDFHGHPAVEWRCFTNSYANCSYSRCLRPGDLTTGMLHRNHCWQADRWTICAHAFDDTAIETALDPLEMSTVVHQVFVEHGLLSDEQ